MVQEESMESTQALSYSACQLETESAPCGDRSRLQSLPLEIIDLVLSELASAAPAPYEHSPDLILGPQSPWVRYESFKKGLTLVCRAWWEPTTRMLYNRITLRRMGQISALARTLSTASEAGFDFSACVEHLGLHECAILKPFADVVLEDLRCILRCCTALRSFSMVLHFNYGSGVWQWLGSSLDVTWMSLQSVHSIFREGLAATLRHLDIHLNTDSPVAIVGLCHMLSEMPQLQSLKLEPLYLLDMPDEHAVVLAALPVVSLPALNELKFSTRCLWFTDWATVSLRLPNLTSLTFIDYDGHVNFSFLAAHGARLTYLQFYPQCGDAADPYRFATYVDICGQLANVSPLLEHLVICSTQLHKVLNDFNDSAQPLLHLRCVDIWLSIDDCNLDELLKQYFTLYDSETGGSREKFPALGDNVRFLSYRGHIDLPDKICPPSALAAADGVRAVYIRDVCVVQTRRCVRANEDFAQLRDEVPMPGSGQVDEDDEEQDPTFILDSDDEDKTSWISDDTSDSEDGPEDGSQDACDTWNSDDVLTERIPHPMLRQALHERWDF